MPAAKAFGDFVLYRDLIDAWSMRHFAVNSESGHDHAFDTFGRFVLATNDHLGEMLAEAVSHAGHKHLLYVEFMLGPDNGGAAGRRQGLDRRHGGAAAEADRQTD